MSSESSSGDNSSSRSSSDSSSMGFCTQSRSVSERAVAQSPNAWNDNLASECPTGGYPGPSHDGAGEETDTDVEIMEEGEEGETTGQC